MPHPFRDPRNALPISVSLEASRRTRILHQNPRVIHEHPYQLVEPAPFHLVRVRVPALGGERHDELGPEDLELEFVDILFVLGVGGLVVVLDERG